MIKSNLGTCIEERAKPFFLFYRFWILVLHTSPAAEGCRFSVVDSDFSWLLQMLEISVAAG